MTAVSVWDRIAWALLSVAIVLGAEAINEGVREHDVVLGLIIGAVALGVVGLWYLVRWYEARR
jgi:hypothetical protein